MTLTDHDMRRVAVEAYVDVRTVAKWLRGEKVRVSVAERIAAAVRKLGLREVRT